MSHDKPNILDQTRNQAEDWLILLQSGDATEFDRRRFKAWLNESQENIDSYESISSQWNSIAQLMDTPQYYAITQSIEPSFFERVCYVFTNFYNALLKSSDDLYETYSTYKLSTAVSLTVCAMLTMGYIFDNQVSTQDFVSGKGEIRNITLKDGSQLILSADSSAQVKFSRNSREVSLLTGQAFFSVTKDKQRPFIVNTGETKVRVIGTQFDVNKSTKDVKIAVVEGVVEVSKEVLHTQFDNKVSISQLTLTRGQAISAENTKHAHFSSIRDVELDSISPWQQGRLQYNNANLDEILADANRFYSSKIELADDELATLKATASFKTDEIAKTFEDLALILPIEVHIDDNKNIVITRENKAL